VTGGGEPIRQPRRQYQIPKLQPRKQHLTETARIDHPVRTIEVLQRRQWQPCITKLAIVIILDDPGIALARPRLPSFADSALRLAILTCFYVEGY
jgi:hypothetical protein